MLSGNDLKVLNAISEGLSDPQSIAEKLKTKVETVQTSDDMLEEQCAMETLSKLEYLIQFKIFFLRLVEFERSLNKGLEIAHLDIGMVSCYL